MMMKYITTIENIKYTIERYGVAIIEDVLDENECESMISGIWDYFEHITKDWDFPINRENKLSWNDIRKLLPLHSMLFQHFSIGQSKVCWDIRRNDKVLDIFSQIYDVKKEELLVSFDGLSFHLPVLKYLESKATRGKSEMQKEREKICREGKKSKYHCDQSYLDNKFKCIQSWITGLDIEDGDATLAFLEGSNNFHKKFRDNFVEDNDKEFKDNWYKLSDEDIKFYKDNGCEEVFIKCKKGSLVLWDSRTIHCGIEPSINRNSDKIRAVIYLCYSPRKFSTKKDLEKRIKAYEEKRMTTHWVNKVKLFPKEPRTYGRILPKINEIDRVELDYIGKRLVGY